MLIVTPETVPAAITQLSERQDRLAASIDALAEQLAGAADRDERQDQQMRILARSLRETAAEQSRTIAAIGKAANGKSANGDASKGKGNGNGKSKAADNPGNGKGKSANPGDARGKGNVTALVHREGKAVGRAIRETEKVTATVAPPATQVDPAAEPEPPRKRAHRWI